MKRVLPLLLVILSLPAHAALRGTATAANSATASSISVTVSGIGIQSGDVVLLLVMGGGGTSNTFTYPTGFNAITGLSNIGITGQGTTIGVACKDATASEPASYSVSYSTTDYLTAVVRVYSGRKSCSNITAVSTTNDASAGSSPVTYALNGVTPASGDDVVVFIGNHYYDGFVPTYSAASGFANSLTTYATTNFSPVVTSSDFVNHAGTATGTIGGTYTVASGNPQYYGGYVISLPQAAAGACTHDGYTSAGALAVPDGSTGSYLGKTGTYVTPDCSTIPYWQPKLGAFGTS